MAAGVDVVGLHVYPHWIPVLVGALCWPNPKSKRSAGFHVVGGNNETVFATSHGNVFAKYAKHQNSKSKSPGQPTWWHLGVDSSRCCQLLLQLLVVIITLRSIL